MIGAGHVPRELSTQGESGLLGPREGGDRGRRDGICRPWWRDAFEGQRTGESVAHYRLLCNCPQVPSCLCSLLFRVFLSLKAPPGLARIYLTHYSPK